MKHCCKSVTRTNLQFSSRNAYNNMPRWDKYNTVWICLIIFFPTSHDIGTANYAHASTDLRCTSTISSRADEPFKILEMLCFRYFNVAAYRNISANIREFKRILGSVCVYGLQTECVLSLIEGLDKKSWKVECLMIN